MNKDENKVPEEETETSSGEDTAEVVAYSDSVREKNKETVIAKKKRRLKISIIIVIASLILLYVIVSVQAWVQDMAKERKKEELDRILNKESITFYPEDYGENIFENSEYMALNRSIKYTEGSESFYPEEDEDLSKYSYEVKFMAGLIDNIIRGDAESYNAAFVDNYWEKNPNDYRETFTMQKLYRTEIEFIKNVTGEVTTTDADGTFYYVNTDFKVSYMIYHNNGSFRLDIPENAHVPVVYKLWAKYRPGILEPFEIKVYEVISNAKYESGLYD